MKAVAKQTSYISAYPLKVLEQSAAAAPESPNSGHLKALLNRKPTPAMRIRVAPMIQPYKLPTVSLPLRLTAPAQQQEPLGNDWFKHYE